MVRSFRIASIRLSDSSARPGAGTPVSIMVRAASRTDSMSSWAFEAIDSSSLECSQAMSRASGGGVMRRGYSSWGWGADFKVICEPSVRVLSRRNPVESTISRTRYRHNGQVISGQQCPEGVRERLPAHCRLRASEAIGAWPDYRPTELRRLKALSGELGLSSLHYKDESERFGLASFKALGGAYAVQVVLRDVIGSAAGRAITLADVAARQYPEEAAAVTVVTATDGNHGRSVAWGADG